MRPSYPPDGDKLIKTHPGISSDHAYPVVSHSVSCGSAELAGWTQFLFSPRWYDKTINLMADFTAASQRGLQCRMVLSAAPIKIGKRRPNQEAAQRLLNAGWQVKVMAGNRTLHEKLIVIDYSTVIFGSHNLAWTSISKNFELSTCIEDPDLNRQAEALFWQRWKLAGDPGPNAWELVTPLDLPFVP